MRFLRWCQNTYPLHKYNRSAPILHAIRSIKSTIEIDLITQACNITNQAFRRVLKFLRPGLIEYEIEAEICHEFLRRGACFAYEPIVASGKRSCILHYGTNNNRCQPGDVVLLDFGADYAHYASDVTRVIPVDKKIHLKTERSIPICS